MKQKSIKRLAIVKLSAMGDIIHAMVALQYIKKEYPDLIIDWFVEKAFSSVLQYNPHIDNIYEVNLKSIKKDKLQLFSQIKLIKEYSKNNYDLVIDAQGLIKSAIVARLLGKNVAGFSSNSTREGQASFFYKQKIDSEYDKNVIERNIEVLCKPFNIEVSKDDILKKDAFLYSKDEQKEIYNYLKKDKKNILFVIGASWPSKMYSKDKFAQVINMLGENCLIAWGSDEEKQIAEEIAKNSQGIVLPKLDLNSLKSIISQCDLIIGNDTGPTHMAWALNTPSITLFGNTPGYRNTYTTNVNKVLESNSKVNPFKLDKNDFSISTIKEEEIVALSKELLL